MTDNEKTIKSFDVNFWVGRWEEKNTPWHQTDVNRLLMKYIGLLDGGKKNLKIFVPLCGKTLDIKWLFDQGHRVVGVEASRLGVEDFFKEQSIDYTIEMQNEIPAFRANSGGIVIYCCDIYDFHKTGEGSFDAIWDRGSLAAVNPGDRTRYLDLLSTLKAASCPHLIELYEYDDNVHKAFPYNIPMSKVVELFGDRYDVKLIETEDASEVKLRLKVEFKSIIRNLFLVTLKK